MYWLVLAIRDGRVPEALSQVVRKGTCAAFIGSGLSAGSYPAWPDLVNDLCQACGIDRRVTSESDDSELLQAAQEAKTNDRERYHQRLWETFGGEVLTVPTAYLLLLELPFNCYLTHNFDRILVTGARLPRADCRMPVQVYPRLDRRDVGARSIHYLHGLVPDDIPPVDGQIVLSLSDFNDAYAPNSNLMNFLVPTLENDPVVFVGCELSERFMHHAFAICKEHQRKRQKLIATRGDVPTQPPPRFILLRRPSVVDERDQYNADLSAQKLSERQTFYENMDIQPVWYGGEGSDHSELRRALERLANLPELRLEYGWPEGGA